MSAAVQQLLPHDRYATAVLEALHAAQVVPADAWTDAVDGELLLQLEYEPTPAWSRDGNHGVAVTWTQLDGWQYAAAGPAARPGTRRELLSAVLPPPSAVVAAVLLLLDGRVVDLPVRWSGPEDTAAGIRPLEGEEQLLADTAKALGAWAPVGGER